MLVCIVLVGIILVVDKDFTLSAGTRSIISVRQFDTAAADLTRVSELDGQNFDIRHHLGLVHFISGNLTKFCSC